MIEWHSEKIEVSQLKEYKSNPRDFTEKGMADLKKSIERFGIAEPICCNPDYTIIGGHARKKTLIELDIKEVLIHIPDRKLNAKEIKELNIRLNKNQAGVFNFDLLANNYDLPDLMDWGFTEGELDLDLWKGEIGYEGDNKNGIELKSLYEIVIECKNENEQEIFYNELSTKYKCRLLTI